MNRCEEIQKSLRFKSIIDDDAQLREMKRACDEGRALTHKISQQVRHSVWVGSGPTDKSL